VAGQHRGVAFFLQFTGVDFEPHQEHEDDHANLAQRIQESQARCRKQIRGKVWRKPAEQRWPQHNAGKHFSDDPRLLKFSEECARQTARSQNHRNL